MGTESDEGNLEDKVTALDTRATPIEATELSVLEKKNTYEQFGITDRMLRKLSYKTVQQIHYGVHNFNYPSLYEFMNPTEVLGLFAGIGRKDLTYNTCIDGYLPTTLSKLVSVGYSISARTKNNNSQELTLAEFSEKLDDHVYQYTTNKGDFQKRINALDNSIKITTARELDIPAKIDIYDPNCDAKKETMQNKNHYIDIIMNAITAQYNEYHQQKSNAP